MPTNGSDPTEDARLRTMIESWTAALRARDVDALAAHYAPELLNFDLAPPLVHRGVERNRENWAAWFRTFTGPIDYAIRDLEIAVRGDVAFFTGLGHIGGARTDGSQTSVWTRVTVGLRKRAGHWKIVHEHASVPFYMDGSYKAAVDLVP